MQRLYRYDTVIELLEREIRAFLAELEAFAGPLNRPRRSMGLAVLSFGPRQRKPATSADPGMPLPPPAEHPGTRPSRGYAVAAWEQTPRFIRNVAISLPTFILDLALLFVLVRGAHLNYLVATVVSFLVANGLGYFLARSLVFVGTRRGMKAGLVYFLAIAALSALALTPLMWLAVSVFHVGVMLSRILSASIVGVGGYVLNLIFNFRVGRRRPRLRASVGRLPQR